MCFFRRRRAVRRITNVSLITTLSLTTAYVIVRPTGGAGFPPPKSARKPFSPVSPAPAMATLPEAISPVSSSRVADGYELATGPYAVSEVDDLVLHDLNRSKDLHVRIFYPNDSGKYPVIAFRTVPAALRTAASPSRATGRLRRPAAQRRRRKHPLPAVRS